MSDLSSSALSLIRLQHGAVSGQQLARCGLGVRSKRRLVLSGTLIEVHRDVYRHAATPDSLEQRCALACLADSGIVISGPTAGRLLRIRRMPHGPIHAMSLRRKVDLEDVIVHRTTTLDPERDIVYRADGIRVLAPRRLVFDLARFLDDVDFESVVEQLLDRRLTNVPAMFAAGRRLKKSGRDGSTRFARVLWQRPAWAKPKHSDLEVKLLQELRLAGVALQAQCEVRLPDGSVVHLDGGDPVRRFGVEVDHVTWHGGRIASQYDKWRDRQLARLGWMVPRVTDEDLRRRFDETVAELVELHQARQIA